MKYIPLLIGIIVAILLIGLVFAFVPRVGGVKTAALCPTTCPYANQTYANNQAAYPYQAGIYTTAAPLPVQTVPVVNTVNMAYPANYGYTVVPAAPIVPVVWYTAPSQNYTYLYGYNSSYRTAPSSYSYSYPYNYSYSNTSVYPGYTQVIPGNTQVYQYSNQYSTGYNSGGGMWYQ